MKPMLAKKYNEQNPKGRIGDKSMSNKKNTLRNNLITEEYNALLNEAIADLERKGFFGISERLEHAVEREHSLYTRVIINAGVDFERRDALIKDYSENVIRCLIRNAKEEANT